MDCVRFSLADPPSSLDSTLSTPELSSPSSLSSSSSDDSFVSVPLASGDEEAVPSIVTVDSEPHKAVLARPSAPKVDTSKATLKPTLVLDTSFLPQTPKAVQQPRKLKKAPPPALPLTPLPGPFSPQSIKVKSPESIRPSRLRRSQTQVGDYPALLKRNRRGSLPPIPTGCLVKETNEKMDSKESKISFLSPQGRSSKKPNFNNLRSPHPRRVHRERNTDLLANFAYTGQFPSSVTPSFFALSGIGESFFLPSSARSGRSATINGGLKSTWSIYSSDDEFDEDEDEDELSPGFSLGSHSPILPLTSSKLRSPRNHHRRWTLAMAVTDEDITDEMFIDQLERMREKERRYSPISPSTPLASGGLLSATSSTGACEGRIVDSPIEEEQPGSPVRLKRALPSLSTPGLANVWQSARRTLLTCREFVRTERHYLSSLWALSNGDMVGKAPPLMLTYLPALVDASEAFLMAMEENPSAHGVAAAFLACNNALETAFVAWCGVVGDFFVEEEESSQASGGLSSASSKGSAKRRVGTWSKRIRSLGGAGRPKLTRAATTPVSAYSHHSAGSGSRRSVPTIRDMAIQPTQRVVRYALLFKDLLSNTPQSSSSYGTVELALQASLATATKCDRAQGNAAFLRSPALPQ